MNLRQLTRGLFTLAAAATMSWATVQAAHAVNPANKGQLAAYVWADKMSEKTYTPNDTYYFNIAKGPASITRNAVGVYVVKLGGVGNGGGHAQVTSYGGGATMCKIASWGPQATDQLININCYGPNGAPVDSMFALAVYN